MGILLQICMVHATNVMSDSEVLKWVRQYNKPP
jgi:hypothetical protein